MYSKMVTYEHFEPGLVDVFADLVHPLVADRVR